MSGERLVNGPDDMEYEVRPPAKYDLLEDEHGLWRLWCTRDDHQAREKLISFYLPYARALAARLFARRTHDEFEFDEYLQFATVGLIEAVNRFDPDRGILFKTYSTTRINGAVLTGLASLSERQQQISLRRRIATERIQSLKDDDVSPNPEDLLRKLAEIGIGLALGYLLEGTGMISESESTLQENTYSRIEMQQFRQQILFLTKRLTVREQEVIHMHYHQGFAFEEVARSLDLTKGRISQLHSQALKKLRSLILQIQSCDIAL